MKLYISILILIISVASCKTDSKHEDGDVAFLGGEIINPNTNFVVISKSNQVLDTIILDKTNRFLHKIKHLQPGLYQFKHGSEIQVVFLEPKDSIIFRLNTLEFDESLVYTGEGAKKNNYLINEFLENEIEEKGVFKYCQLEPIAFEKKIDSIRSVKNNKLKSFSNKHDASTLFHKIAKSNIDYKYYASKEIYPFVHYGENKHNILTSLPKNFYSYRKNIDYNDDFLKDYFNYNAFLRSNFNNLALKEHFVHTKDSHVKRSSVCYNLDRLNLIDSLVTNTAIKNDLLYHYTISFLSKNPYVKNNHTILKSFLSKSSDDKNKTMMTQYAKSLDNLKPGDDFPDFQVVNYQNTEFNSKDLIIKPTAICFWSHTFLDHFKKSHVKINELKTKYPEINFIIINVDDYNTNTWISTLENNRFSINNEYQFRNPEASRHQLAVHPMTKVIMVNKKNKIVNSNANIFSLRFEQELLGLINQ
jgi:hypothetical protein